MFGTKQSPEASGFTAEEIQASMQEDQGRGLNPSQTCGTRACKCGGLDDYDEYVEYDSAQDD